MRKTLLVCGLIFALMASLAFAEGAKDTGTAAAATGEPQYGGTLTHKIHWNGNGPNTWDTSDLARGIAAHTWTSPYAETLLVGDIEKYGPRGNKEYSFSAWELVPEPYLKGHLAESWEWTGPLTLVYHIRKGVKWAGKAGVMESREMTAEDIAYSMNRTWQRYKQQGSKQFDYVKSVTATDKYTVVIELNKFYADWAFHLGYRGIVQAIYPREVAEKGAHDWRNQVGTGPFMLTNYVEGSQAVYKKNPNYWGKTTINGKEYKLPFVDKLVIPTIPDMSTAIAALRTGKIDWQVNVPLEYTETLTKTSPGLKFTRYLAGQTAFAALKMTQKPFDDVRVRRALMIGSDLQAIAKTVYIEADIHGGPMNALTPYYTPMDKLPPEVKELYSNDQAKAKKLLADAGYPNGFKMKMYVNSTDQKTQAAIEMLKDQWKGLNVTLEMMPVESTNLANREAGRGTPQRPGDYEDSLISTMATCTPWVAYDRLGLITSIKNPARYDDPYFRDQFAKAMETRDQKELIANIKDLAVHWLKDVPYIPFPNPYFQTGYWPWVRNYYGEVECAYYNFSAMQARIWIDQSMKKSMGF